MENVANIGHNMPPHKIAFQEAEYFAERCADLSVFDSETAQRLLT
jgi:hypothetical protein